MGPLMDGRSLTVWYIVLCIELLAYIRIHWLYQFKTHQPDSLYRAAGGQPQIFYGWQCVGMLYQYHCLLCIKKASTDRFKAPVAGLSGQRFI